MAAAAFCLAAAMLLASCDASGSPAEPPVKPQSENAFSFGGITGPLRFAAFSTDLDKSPVPSAARGFSFFLDAPETPDSRMAHFFIDIPTQLMGYTIDLSWPYPNPYGWSWYIEFWDGGKEGFWYDPLRPKDELPAGTMRVDRTDTANVFRITVEGILGGRPFSLYYNGVIPHIEDVWVFWRD